MCGWLALEARVSSHYIKVRIKASATASASFPGRSECSDAVAASNSDSVIGAAMNVRGETGSAGMGGGYVVIPLAAGSQCDSPGRRSSSRES